MGETNQERRRSAATSASYSITMRLHTDVDPSLVGGIATAIAAAGRASSRRWTSRSRATTASSSTSPARRPTPSTRTRSSPPSASSRASRCTRSPTAPSCCTSAGRSRSPRRCRCAPATTSRWPTRPASAGSAWRSPSTRRTCPALTIKGNSVAVVTDGSAVLGLGNIGPGAALPVMEGKAALFKRFADIDAWPICLDTQDTDRIVDVVARDRARLRRHQPRGHRGAALLRDRAPAARAAGHPGVPRRPARHRDRGAGRADQRAALRRQAARRASASWWPAPARRVRRS